VSKLVTLGCSLTSQCGVNEHLSKLLNLENLDLSYPAGSNQLQVRRLFELFLNNQIEKDDIVYWQITGVYRNYLRLQLDSQQKVDDIQKNNFKDPYHHYTHSKNTNIFDQKNRIEILCNSPLVENTFDENDELQNLLGTIILLKQYCKNVIVVFGWKEVMTTAQEKVFKKLLNDYNIDVVDEYFLEFSKDRSMPMMDDMHPSSEAGVLYAQEVIYKKIKNLGWI
jgi:hypothetical protein